jgi:hypothetical protein
MKLRERLRRKKKPKSGNWDEKTEKWLGSKLLEEEKKLLNNDHLSREELARYYVIMKRNWKLALGEISKLEEEIKRLNVQAKLLSRD